MPTPISKRFSGVFEALGIPEHERALRFGDTLSLALAFPVPHLIKHDFPPGCGQHLLFANLPVHAGQFTVLRITAGRGGFHLMRQWHGATTNLFTYGARRNDDLLTEASAAQLAANQIPDRNDLDTTFWDCGIVAAQWNLINGQPGSFRVGPIATTTPTLTDFGESLRIPPGWSLYMGHTTIATAFATSLIGWESCGP
jgi:hypothetical protein